MPEIISCPECGKKIKVPDGAEGKKLRCGSCESILLATEDGLELAGKGGGSASRKTAADESGEIRKSKRRRDDGDDEDQKPRKRRRDEEEEDEDEEEEPVKKKRLKKKKIPVWVWFAAGGGGCAVVGLLLWLILSSGGSKFGKVKEGMTMDDIVKEAGPATVSRGNIGMWFDPPLFEMDTTNPDKVLKSKEVMTVSFVNGKANRVEILKRSDLDKGRRPPLEIFNQRGTP